MYISIIIYLCEYMRVYISIYMYICGRMYGSININIHIYTLSTVFGNSPGDWGSIPGRVIPKTQKMVIDASLLNTQH